VNRHLRTIPLDDIELVGSGVVSDSAFGGRIGSAGSGRPGTDAGRAAPQGSPAVGIAGVEDRLYRIGTDHRAANIAYNGAVAACIRTAERGDCQIGAESSRDGSAIEQVCAVMPPLDCDWIRARG